MNNFHDIAKRAMIEYRRQPGLISVELEGVPAIGLRYRFDEEASAGRFLTLRSLLSAYEQGERLLHLDGRDVLELWP